MTSISYSDLAAWQNFAVSYPIAMLLAIVTWHVTEEPALRLKDSPLASPPPRNHATAGRGGEVRIRPTPNESVWL